MLLTAKFDTNKSFLHVSGTFFVQRCCAVHQSQPPCVDTHSVHDNFAEQSEFADDVAAPITVITHKLTISFEEFKNFDKIQLKQSVNKLTFSA